MPSRDAAHTRPFLVWLRRFAPDDAIAVDAFDKNEAIAAVAFLYQWEAEDLECKPLTALDYRKAKA